MVTAPGEQPTPERSAQLQAYRDVTLEAAYGVVGLLSTLRGLLRPDDYPRLDRDEEAPDLWAVWLDAPGDSELIGIGEVPTEALRDAIATARGWADQEPGDHELWVHL